MHLTITRFEVTMPIDRDQLATLFEQSLPRYSAVAGLLSKHYYMEPSSRFAGGIYLWSSREQAQAFLTPEFSEAIRARFGTMPTVQVLDCPLTLDNIHGEHRVAATS
jgi:hypothetical protein